MLRPLSFHSPQEYLEDQESVDFTEFAEKIWPNIREIYKVKEQIAEAEAGKDENVGTEEEIEVWVICLKTYSRFVRHVFVVHVITL